MPTTAEYQRADFAHYIHPFTDSRQLGQQARIIKRAEGVYLWDSDGNKILDGMSGLWCVNIGYGRPELAAAATQQMTELPYYNSFFQCATPPAIELAATLAELAPAGFKRVFFTNSGSEANDTVVRMIRRYWKLLEQPQRTVIIARQNAYHGSTIAAASLSGMAAMHQKDWLPIPGIVHIRQPYWFGEGRHQDPKLFGLECARTLADKIEEIGVTKIAAFIAEPVQGAGGAIMPPPTYWPEVQKICDHYRIPIVADEVICAFGRLGHWFGSTHYGIQAKIMPIAKGLTSGYLPMGGVLVHDEIDEVLTAKGGEFTHGYTYSGHPTCAAVALENLRILREEKIIEQVRTTTAPYLARQWSALADHPLVGEVRVTGMIAALELCLPNGQACAPSAGQKCRDLSIALGLVMRAVGNTMVIAPPLIISPVQIDELVAKARQALDSLSAADLRAP